MISTTSPYLSIIDSNYHNHDPADVPVPVVRYAHGWSTGDRMLPTVEWLRGPGVRADGLTFSSMQVGR